MRYHLVRGKGGFRIEEAESKDELKAKLAETREAVVHSFGPKMTREAAEAKLPALNRAVKQE